MSWHKKRGAWLENETRQMLLIIKEKYISKLLLKAGSHKLKIFDEISKDMEKFGYKKNASQIQVKFKTFKIDYKKLIENSGNYLYSMRRLTEQHLDLLHAIFGNSVANTNESTVKIETEEEPAVADPFEVTTYRVFQIKTEEDEDDGRDLTEEIKLEIDEASSAYETPEVSADINTEKQETDTAATSTEPVKTFQQQKRHSYQNVVENFTREWKHSQFTLLQTMEQQDKKYLRAFEAQCKRQEAMLREDRQEMEQILKQDREEMKSFFVSLLQTLGQHAPN